MNLIKGKNFRFSNFAFFFHELKYLDSNKTVAKAPLQPLGQGQVIRAKNFRISGNMFFFRELNHLESFDEKKIFGQKIFDRKIF